MTHDLARILPPPVFGVTVWLCRCGHHSFSENERQRHERKYGVSVWRKPRLVASPHRIVAVLCQEDYEGLLTLERYGVPVKRFYATKQEMIEIGHAT